MRQAADALLGHDTQLTFSQPAQLLCQMAKILQDTLGGTIGALLPILLLRTASALQEAGCTGAITPSQLGTALKEGCDAVSGVGGAQEGDCTLLDALLPASRCLVQHRVNAIIPNQANLREEWEEWLRKAAQAADAGATETTMRRARAGRAAYVGQRSVGVEDGGARVVALLFQGALQAMSGGDAHACSPAPSL